MSTTTQPEVLATEWLFQHEWNFGELPPASAVSNYMKSLLICTKGDGVISPQEREWVVGYSAAMGGSAELVEEMRTYEGDDDLASLVSMEPSVDASRGALVFDAIRASDADGELAPGELETIREMAGLLGVPEVVDPLYDLYKQESDIRAKRNALTHPSGAPL
jgi:hypothetical protein